MQQEKSIWQWMECVHEMERSKLNKMIKKNVFTELLFVNWIGMVVARVILTAVFFRRDIKRKNDTNQRHSSNRWMTNIYIFLLIDVGCERNWMNEDGKLFRSINSSLSLGLFVRCDRVSSPVGRVCNHLLESHLYRLHASAVWFD